MIFFGVSDLFKAISKKFEGNMRKPEEIPGNPEWFYHFMICLGVSDLFKAVSKRIEGNTVDRFYNIVGFILAFGSPLYHPVSKGGSVNIFSGNILTPLYFERFFVKLKYN